MTEAYFVGRSELLAWINSTLDLRLSKVEETANGAVVCQLLDALYPGTVPMKKVDFNAKNEYDMINNYKVMQDVFNKLGVDKHVDVAKLIKARPLDNIEFLQWLKAYWDTQTGGQPIDEYDPVSRRQQCKTGNLKSGGSAAPAAQRSAAASAGALPARRAACPVYAGKSQPTTPQASGSLAAVGARSKRSLISASSSSDTDTIERLQEELATWRSAAETVTKEKDFYYSKLRAIELLCNTPGVTGHPVAKAAEDILYAATQEEGEQCLAAAIAELEVRDESPAAEALLLSSHALGDNSGAGCEGGSEEAGAPQQQQLQQQQASFPGEEAAAAAVSAAQE